MLGYLSESDISPEHGIGNICILGVTAILQSECAGRRLTFSTGLAGAGLGLGWAGLGWAGVSRDVLCCCNWGEGRVEDTGAAQASLGTQPDTRRGRLSEIMTRTVCNINPAVWTP